MFLSPIITQITFEGRFPIMFPDIALKEWLYFPLCDQISQSAAKLPAQHLLCFSWDSQCSSPSLSLLSTSDKFQNEEGDVCLFAFLVLKGLQGTTKCRFPRVSKCVTRNSPCSDGAALPCLAHTQAHTCTLSEQGALTLLKNTISLTTP